MLRTRGEKISHLIIYSLWPVPEDAIAKAVEGCKRVIVPEMNLGQYVLEIERICKAIDNGIEIIPINKMDTTLISPDEIIIRGGL